MEERLRRLEAEMKSASGETLESMLQEYSRLNHEFEMADGYSVQSEITGVLKGLGFAEEEFSKSIDALSGGQKTRVSLGKLLLTKPDVLLLDEPPQPPGYGVHRLAGSLPADVSGKRAHRGPMTVIFLTVWSLRLLSWTAEPPRYLPEIILPTARKKPRFGRQSSRRI